MPYMRPQDWKKEVEKYMEELFYTGKTEIPRWLLLRAHDKQNGGRVTDGIWKSVRGIFDETFVDEDAASIWTYSIYKLTSDHNNTSTPYAFLLVMDERLVSSGSEA